MKPLQGIAWLFFVAAGLAFWFGGGFIHTVLPKTDRALAEMESIALAILCAGLGAIAKAANERLEAGEVDPNGLIRPYPVNVGDYFWFRRHSTTIANRTVLNLR